MSNQRLKETDELIKFTEKYFEWLREYLNENPKVLYRTVGKLNSQEPKKVSVEEELVCVLHELNSTAGFNLVRYREAAKAAIEFFRARMPKLNTYIQYTPDYNQALKDVRKALFGEE